MNYNWQNFYYLKKYEKKIKLLNLIFCKIYFKKIIQRLLLLFQHLFSIYNFNEEIYCIVILKNK